MEEKIVVLDNGKQYCILDEVLFKDKKYCCAVEYFEEQEELGEEYFVFEESIIGDSLSLTMVEDKELEDYVLFRIVEENEENNINI